MLDDIGVLAVPSMRSEPALKGLAVDVAMMIALARNRCCDLTARLQRADIKGRGEEGGEAPCELSP